MRLPRPRLRLWTLLIAVAVIGATLGVGLWGVRMKRLRDLYLGRAGVLAAKEREVRAIIELEEGALREDRNHPFKDVLSEIDYPQLAILVGLRNKYERAARYPWLPLEPDSQPRPEYFHLREIPWLSQPRWSE